ncbi:hypothetical protein Y032_0024g897 [Ancylostoma ceylanicum]|uniref:Uncharacterized protein n=1 Tax=Ancylostoma ceylanicum TaxID=53326 RepID=A0A016UVP9_9BILA|nr:hypothetical protein Y032_0024g897 [Ancylostoma ceylanicum]
MAARTIHNGVNELVKTTILAVEKILKHLPQKGDRVDVVTASGRNDYNPVDDIVRENKNTSVLIIDQQPNSTPTTPIASQSTVDRSSKPRRLAKATGQILSDSVRVTPLDNMNGMLIDMVLRLKKEHSNDTKLIDISIECPDFKASRICVDGTWYKIA